MKEKKQKLSHKMPVDIFDVLYLEWWKYANEIKQNINRIFI